MIVEKDDDLPPPLEDLSHLINPKKLSFKNAPVNASNIDADNKKSGASKPAPINGMKKGFLLSSPKRTSSASKISKSASASLPLIKPTPAKNPLVLDQVQEAMKLSHPLTHNTDHITPDFLSQIETNPILSRALKDPLFGQAAQEVSEKPESIQKWAALRPDFVDALKTFAGMLGQAYEDMHVKQVKQQIKVPEDLCQKEKDLIEAVMNDSEVQAIFRDNEIKGILDGIRKDPPSLARVMRTANEKHFNALKKLIDIGFLSVQ